MNTLMIVMALGLAAVGVFLVLLFARDNKLMSFASLTVVFLGLVFAKHWSSAAGALGLLVCAAIIALGLVIIDYKDTSSELELLREQKDFEESMRGLTGSAHDSGKK